MEKDSKTGSVMQSDKPYHGEENKIFRKGEIGSENKRVVNSAYVSPTMSIC